MVSMVRNVSPKNQNELLEETCHRSPFSPLNRTRKRADGGKCCRALWNSFWGQVWKKGILWNNCSITDHGVQQIWVQILLCRSAVWQAVYVQSQSLGTVSSKRAIMTSVRYTCRYKRNVHKGSLHIQRDEENLPSLCLYSGPSPRSTYVTG